MGQNYRDDLAAVRSRASALRDAAVGLEQGLGALFWEALSPEVGRALREARGAMVGDPATLEGDALYAFVDGAERYLGTLQPLLARLPEAEARWSVSLPEPPPLVPEPPPLLTPLLVSEAQRRDAALWKEIVCAVDPSAGWVSDVRARGVCEGRVCFDGVVVRVLWQAAPNSNLPDRLTLGVSMPLASAPMRLCPQGWSDEVLAALRLRRDVKLGESLFDGYFVVDAEPEVARVYLPNAARAGLLRVALEDVPQGDVGPGMATLSWRYGPSEPALRAALGVLALWHRLPPTRSFRA